MRVRTISVLPLREKIPCKTRCIQHEYALAIGSRAHPAGTTSDFESPPTENGAERNTATLAAYRKQDTSGIEFFPTNAHKEHVLSDPK